MSQATLETAGTPAELVPLALTETERAQGQLVPVVGLLGRFLIALLFTSLIAGLCRTSVRHKDSSPSEAKASAPVPATSSSIPLPRP